MRMYSDCKEALNEIIRDVFSRGVTCYDRTVQSKSVASMTHTAKELLGYDYAIIKPTLEDAAAMIKYADTVFKKEHLTVEYAQDWLDEMLKGNLNPGKAHMKHWPEYWNTFSEIPTTGKFAYTYSERIGDGVEKIIELLKDNRYRRAAYIPIWFEVDNGRRGQRRVPCSIGYHFLVRNDGIYDRLNLFYFQRSCSLAEFYPLDVYRAVGLLDRVCEHTGIDRGNLIHFVSSLHCFYKDLQNIDRTW